MALSGVSTGILCAAEFCYNCKGSSPQLSFFRFPADPVRCNLWVKNCETPDLNDKEIKYLSTHYHLCADHFEEHFFTSSARKRLLKHSVPTIFPVKGHSSERMRGKRAGEVTSTHGDPPPKTKRGVGRPRKTRPDSVAGTSTSITLTKENTDNTVMPGSAAKSDGSINSNAGEKTNDITDSDQSISDKVSNQSQSAETSVPHSDHMYTVFPAASTQQTTAKAVPKKPNSDPVPARPKPESGYMYLTLDEIAKQYPNLLPAVNNALNQINSQGKPILIKVCIAPQQKQTVKPAPTAKVTPSPSVSAAAPAVSNTTRAIAPRAIAPKPAPTSTMPILIGNVAALPMSITTTKPTEVTTTPVTQIVTPQNVTKILTPQNVPNVAKILTPQNVTKIVASPNVSQIVTKPDATQIPSSTVQTPSTSAKVVSNLERITGQELVSPTSALLKPIQLKIAPAPVPLHSDQRLSSMVMDWKVERFEKKLTELRLKLRSKNVHVCRLKKRIKKLEKNQFPMSGKKKAKLLIEGAAEFLPKESWQFMASQINMSLRKAQGRRWSEEDKLMALSIYYQSHKAYMFLCKVFALPCKTTLRRWTKTITIRSGFSDELQMALREKVKAMKDQDKVCVLCIGETSLKPGLSYDRIHDEVVGFEDFGDSRSDGIATSALIFLLRGLSSNWKQTISYAFSAESAKSSSIHDMTLKSIGWALGAGLTVVAIVTDHSPNFVEMATGLGVTPDVPYFMLEGGQKIFHIYDPPQLFRMVRNCLRKYAFEWEGKKRAEWKDIDEFHKFDSQQKYRLAPGLSEKQVKLGILNKKKMMLARQVLNHSVAAGIESRVNSGDMAPEATGTADFVNYMDKLFASCNSSQLQWNKRSPRSDKMPINNGAEHLAFMRTCSEWLETVRIVDSKEQDVTSSVACIELWRVTLSSFQKLWEYLREVHGFTCLFTRRLNLDALESLMNIIRRYGLPTAFPTPIQFMRVFKRECLNMLLDPTASAALMEDASILLSRITSMTSSDGTDSPESEVPIFPKVTATTVKNERPLVPELPEDNAFIYMCSFLAKKIGEKHVCDVCRVVLYKEGTSENADGELLVPTDTFCQYIYQLELQFVADYQTFACFPTTAAMMVERLSTICSPFDCETFPLDIVMKNFVQMCIQQSLKFSNKVLSETAKKDKKVFKIALDNVET